VPIQEVCRDKYLAIREQNVTFANANNPLLPRLSKCEDKEKRQETVPETKYFRKNCG
jgi:hypothetical protein